MAGKQTDKRTPSIGAAGLGAAGFAHALISGAKASRVPVSYADGDLTGPYAPGSKKPHFSRTEALQLCEEVLAKHDDATVFINGMNTSLERHRDQAQALANARGGFVVGVYNASSNPTAGSARTSMAHPGDLPQALLDSQGLVAHNAAARTVTRLIDRYGSAKHGKIGLRIYGHSQGSMIAVSALRAARSHGTDVTKVHAKLAGTMVRTAPSGPMYDAAINVDDFVALGSRIGLELVVDPPAAPIRFVSGTGTHDDQSLLRHTIIRMKGGGHDLIDGYLDDETNAPAVRRPLAGPLRTIRNFLMLHGGWVPVALGRWLEPHVRKALEWSRKTGGRAWYWTGARIRHLIETAVGAAHRAARHAREVAARVWQGARNAARRAWERAKTIAARAVQRARTAARNALDWARRTAQRARQKATTLARRAWELGQARIRNAAQAARRAASSAWAWAKRTASNLWNWANRRSGGAFDWVAQKVRSTWDRARSLARQATERARRIRSSALRWVRDRGRQLWAWALDQASSAYERMRGRAGHAWDWAKATGRSAWDRARHTGLSVWRAAWGATGRARSLARRVADTWWNRLKTVGGAIWNLREGVLSAGYGLLAVLVRGATAWGRSVHSRVRNVIRHISGPIGRFARRAAGKASGFVRRTGSKAWSWARNAAGRAWDFAKSLAGRASKGFARVTRPAHKVWDWGRKKLGSAYRWASSRVRAAIQHGAGAASKALALARAVGGRLGRGVQSAFRWLGRLIGPRVGQARNLVGRVRGWVGRLGSTARRGISRVWQRLQTAMRNPLPSLGRGVRSLGAFVLRTLTSAIRRVSRGLGVLSSRGGSMLGRLLQAATRGAGVLGRSAGTLLSRLLRRAIRPPGTVGSWAGAMLGGLLRRTVGVARTLDRATGGAIGSLMGRLASGAGSAGSFVRSILSRAGQALVSGGGRMGQFLGGLMGRLLGGAARGAASVRQTAGRLLGRLFGAGVSGLRRADGLTGGFLGRIVGRGVRGAHQMGAMLGHLASRAFGAATHGAQLLGGAAGAVIGRLMGHASRGAGVTGALLGRVVGRVVGTARRAFGPTGGTLGGLAARGLGLLARGIGVARNAAGSLLGRAVGRGARAVSRLQSFVGRTAGRAARALARTVTAQRSLIYPIGHALGRAAGRLGRLVPDGARGLGTVARRAFGAVGAIARLAGGGLSRAARATGGFIGRAGRQTGRFLRRLTAPAGSAVSRGLGAIGSTIRAVVGRTRAVAQRVAAPVRRVAGRVGGAASRVADTIRRSVGRVGGWVSGRGASIARPIAVRVSTLAHSVGAVAARSLGTVASAVRPIASAATSRIAGAVRSAAGLAGSLAGRFRRGLGLARDPLPGSAGMDAQIDAEALRNRLVRGGSTGVPLDARTLATMSRQFGHDFSNVRVHRDTIAADAASAMHARAFAIGSNVFFGPGRFDPYSPRGQSLIAHELTHVVQQTTGRAGGMYPFSRQGGDTLEQEAQLAAKHVLARVGRPQGIYVGDYARTYESEDDSEITTTDQKRLDTISLMALQLAEKTLRRRGHDDDIALPSVDISIALNLGEMSDQQAARVWADAIAEQIIDARMQARVEIPAPVAPKVMRAPETQDPKRPRLTLTEDAKKAIATDVDAITKNIRSWWRKPAEMVSPLRKWYEEDARRFAGQGTPHLDWLLFLMHQRLFDKGTVITRFTSTLDEVERYLKDRPEGALFKAYKSLSKRWKAHVPAKEMEGVLSYVGKRQLYAGWMIIKGMGTALTGLADVGLWAFWKTSGWPLRKVLNKFGIKDEKLYLTPYIDKKFDETADILQTELGIDANEKLFGKVSLKTFSEAGGKVVGGLMTAGALGQAAKAGQAAQVAGNIDKARKIQLGLQAVNVAQGLQQAEQLGSRINQLREGPPPQSWSDIVKRPDVWAQVVGIVGSAVGAKMSWSQAQGAITKTVQQLQLGLNAGQAALLVGAYAAVDDDPTIPAADKAKAKADILAQIVTTGALMADSVWGAKYEAWKQKRADARAQQQAAQERKPGEPKPAKPGDAPEPSTAKPDDQAGKTPAADTPDAEATPAAKRTKDRSARKAAEQQAAKEKTPAATVRQGLDELKALGDWDAMLKRHGADSKTAKAAQAARERIVREICKEHGAKATGTAGAASDVDITFPTEKAIHAAKAKMEAKYGPHWEKLFKASFNSDVMRAHAHLDPRLKLSPEQRAAVEAQLSRSSERAVLERLKAAAAHSDTAKAAFKEELARQGLTKSDVETPHLTKSDVRKMELQQDAAMRSYEKTLRKLSVERTRGRLTPEQLAALQQEAVKQSIDITERQMRINQAYPDRYLTPGGVKGAVTSEVLGKFDRSQYAQREYESLMRRQDPRSPKDPKAVWREAYRRARAAEARAQQWKDLNPQEAYQRALMERLELVEQMAKAEQSLRADLGPSATVTREQVLQRVFERYEFSKYASRAMETARKLGIKGFDDLADVAKGLYKPSARAGGTAARERAISKEAAKPGMYLDKQGRPVAETRSDIRMVVFAAHLDRIQKQIIDTLHNMIQGTLDIPDLPYAQSHDLKAGAARASQTPAGATKPGS